MATKTKPTAVINGLNFIMRKDTTDGQTCIKAQKKLSLKIPESAIL